MTFNDIFKSNFLDQVAGFSFLDMVISLALALAIGLFIFEIYRKTYRGVMYSRSFGVTLLALAMITDLAIMTVTSNVALTLDIWLNAENWPIRGEILYDNRRIVTMDIENFSIS